MRRFLTGCLIVLIALLPTAGASENFSVEAKGAVLIDAASGRILFEQNARKRLPMASTTKIMTAILALENSLPGELVTAGKNASGVEGSSIYLSEGETLTMEHLLYGLMLRSGNDAAVAIAEHVAGTVPDFVEMMNRKAAELNADAHFVNPHGLPAEGHEASALGMALIYRSALTLPDFRVITGTRRKVIPWVGNDYSRVLENKNRLLSTYEGATGGKTGYTKAAGRCLVFSARRNGLELIGVVLGCPTWFDTAARMLDYGFKNYRARTPLTAGQSVGEAVLQGGTSPTASVVAGGDLSSALEENAPFTVHYEYRTPLAAPIAEGDVLGTAFLKSGGTVLSECPLLAAEDIPRRDFLFSLKNLFRNWLPTDPKRTKVYSPSSVLSYCQRTFPSGSTICSCRAVTVKKR